MYGYRAKQRQIFPDPRTECMYEGVLAVSHVCTAEMLFEAYSFGIFPWPQREDEVLWFSPEDRGVLFFKDLHVPQRLQRSLKKAPWELTINRAFDQVIEECAKIPRKHEAGTWITTQLIEAYKEFHKMGYAHSVECWEQNQLVGGMYGVAVGGAVSGESMFFKKSDASKACLLHWIQQLQSSELEWLDIQMVTPLTETFGGVDVPRNEFLDILEISHQKRIDLCFS